MEPLADHTWPTDSAEHVWTAWMSHTSTIKERTQYRSCIHPACGAFEIRPAAAG